MTKAEFYSLAPVPRAAILQIAKFLAINKLDILPDYTAHGYGLEHRGWILVQRLGVAEAMLKVNEGIRPVAFAADDASLPLFARDALRYMNTVLETAKLEISINRAANGLELIDASEHGRVVCGAWPKTFEDVIRWKREETQILKGLKDLDTPEKMTI